MIKYLVIIFIFKDVNVNVIVLKIIKQIKFFIRFFVIEYIEMNNYLQ